MDIATLSNLLYWQNTLVNVDTLYTSWIFLNLCDGFCRTKQSMVFVITRSVYMQQSNNLHKLTYMNKGNTKYDEKQWQLKRK